MATTSHQNFKNWTEQTVTYNRHCGVIGKHITETKTRYILKLKIKTEALQRECLQTRTELMQLRRTKDGKIYKRDMPKYIELKQRQSDLRSKLQRENSKYWKLRRQESLMSHEPIAEMLFDLWSKKLKLSK